MIDCRLNNRRIVFESLCTICAKLSSISLISYFVLCNFWLEIVAKQYAPRSLGWECPKERERSLIRSNRLFWVFRLFGIFDFAFVKSCVNSRTDRSMNDYIEIVIDAIDQWIATPPTPIESWGGLSSNEWNKYANLRILLTICMCFSLFVWYFFSHFPFFLMISGIFESEFN